jgi:hypothetical protein
MRHPSSASVASSSLAASEAIFGVGAFDEAVRSGSQLLGKGFLVGNLLALRCLCAWGACFDAFEGVAPVEAFIPRIQKPLIQ